MNNLVMVKLGGAVLTDKSVPCSLRQDIIESAVSQIAAYLSKSDTKVLIGNGGGSFGHYFAQKYDLSKGVSNQNQLVGMCMGKNGNAYLNTKLTERLVRHNVKACSYAIDDIFWKIRGDMEDSELEHWERLFAYLDYGITPVVYGDIIYDREKGCRIISTEQIFFNLAKVIAKNRKCGYQLEKIIFCTVNNGVEDLDGNIIHHINRNNFQDWEIFEQNIKGYDVTGGMYIKVKLSIDVDVQCPVQIINGNDSESLYKALCGDTSLGTVIS